MRPGTVIGTVIGVAVWTLLVVSAHGLSPGDGRRLPVFAALWAAGGAVFLLGRALSAGRPSRPAGRTGLDTVDPVTGLNNRRSFLALVEPLLESALRSSEKGMVMMLNVDGYDGVLKSHGAGEADRLARLVAKALLDSCRGSDVVARYDRDEFAAYFPKTSLESSQVISERVRGNVSAGRPGTEHGYEVSVSTGYSEFDPVAARSIESLVKAAYDDMLKDLGGKGEETGGAS